MFVKVLFFGQLREIAGRTEDSLELSGPASLSDVFDHYAARFPRFSALAPGIVVARNQQFAATTTMVAEGDEIAFLPPVSGGSDRNYFALTRDPIDTLSLRARLLAGSDGAIVDFVGVVRNNTNGRLTKYLDYECYEPMALRVMTEIGESIAASHSIGGIAMVHRLGRMEIGEASVAVVVTAPHRRPAFEAALEGINRLKKLVPVWKKEYFEDGEVWVEGEWENSVLQR
ncbi:MAG: molybdenum cofactor biosynthesis protein MoaE [Bryobacteraceae bacterium]|nr:molybdenum cofactor biosynthesis protein MoaE [Bryobacteraceae bacterium]